MSHDEKIAEVPTLTPFAVSSEGEGGITVLVVQGELDFGTASQLEEPLRSASEEALIVDLSGCDFIDSSGIALLVASFNEARKNGRQMALCGARQQVLRVLEIAGIADLIPTKGSREEALAAVSG
jgi:anti-sigma B factor antagonist